MTKWEYSTSGDGQLQYVNTETGEVRSEKPADFDTGAGLHGTDADKLLQGKRAAHQALKGEGKRRDLEVRRKYAPNARNTAQ
jgi:hypothetical protein